MLAQYDKIDRPYLYMGVDRSIGVGIPAIKHVIFNDPAVIVFWEDGSKTVAKSEPDTPYDPEKGLLIAMLKRYYGSYSALDAVIAPHMPKQTVKVPVKKKKKQESED